MTAVYTGVVVVGLPSVLSDQLLSDCHSFVTLKLMN